jgi:hypothetical protein
MTYLGWLVASPAASVCIPLTSPWSRKCMYGLQHENHIQYVLSKLFISRAKTWRNWGSHLFAAAAKTHHRH